MKEKGIAVAGVILVDEINEIDTYPRAGELVKISSVKRSVGGCVPNVGIDLKRINPDLFVRAVGRIGKDDYGKFVKKVLIKNGVDVEKIIECENRTSFTQVMSVVGGQRTFFTYAGANAEFGVEDLSLEEIDCDMLHLGYFLLMKKMDEGEGEKVLAKAKALGMKTSIDFVSEPSTRYQKILPCLRYTDNLIINEVEAAHLVGGQTKDLKKNAEILKKYGVKERVIIHDADKGICLSNDGFTIVPSYNLPKDFIKGTTGAGDAFCAGALLKIKQNVSDREILEFAVSAATAALSEVDAIGGMREEEKILEISKNFKRKELC